MNKGAIFFEGPTSGTAVWEAASRLGHYIHFYAFSRLAMPVDVAEPKVWKQDYSRKALFWQRSLVRDMDVPDEDERKLPEYRQKAYADLKADPYSLFDPPDQKIFGKMCDICLVSSWPALAVPFIDDADAVAPAKLVLDLEERMGDFMRRQMPRAKLGPFMRPFDLHGLPWCYFLGWMYESTETILLSADDAFVQAVEDRVLQNEHGSTVERWR